MTGESSPLLPPIMDAEAAVPIVDDDGDRATTSANDEMERPWPATFERSVQILAKATVNKELVAFASESMHILPPTRLKKNTSLSDLNRGWRTPDPQPSRPAARNDGDDDEDETTSPGGPAIFARMGLKKTPTLDWRYQLGGPIPGRGGQGGPTYDDIMKDFRQQRQEAAVPTKAVEEPPMKEMDHGHGHGAPSDEKATFMQCVFNMANMLLGIGILSLPFVFRTAGWLGGSFGLLIFSAVCWWTSILIGRELNGSPISRTAFSDDENDKGNPPRIRKQIYSFPSIAREAFGQPGAILLSIVMYFELFSCLSVFLVSLGDHLHGLFPSISAARHMVLVSAALTVPTALFKTPRLLSYLSAVGTFTTTIVVLAVAGVAIWAGNIAPEMAEIENEALAETVVAPPYHVPWITSGLPVGLGLVAFCFSGHAIVPSIYTSMERPRDFEKMISASFALVLSCCFMVAASGYYMFGSAVSDQITLSLEEAPLEGIESAMTTLSFLMVSTLFTKFALFMFPLALGMEEIVAPIIPNNTVMELAYMSIKLVLIGLSLFVGLYAPSFAFLVSLVGIVCTVTVSVIFPAAAHLKMFGPHLSVWERVVDWAFVLGGIAFALVGTAATVGLGV